MPPRLKYIGRAISLFFRLFILRSVKVMFLPGSFPNGKPAPAPPVVKRLEKKPWVVAGTLVVFTLLLPTLFYFLKIDPVQYADYASYVVVGLFVIGFFIMRRIWREIPALTLEARANDYCLCLICGYCLKGLPEKHRCPECGTSYEIEDVKRKWSEYLADRAARKLPW